MRRALLAIAILAAAPAFAQQGPMAPPGKADASLVAAGTYNIDPGHSQVLFTVNHLGFTEYTGQFVQPTGTLTIDPKSPASAKVDVTFAIDKVQTTVPALDAHLKTKDFFDATTYPTAHFVSTNVAVSGNTATITGNLTLKDVTKPVTLKARFIGAGSMMNKSNVGFAATTTIKRSDFGIKYGIPMVSDDVELTINAAFQK